MQVKLGTRSCAPSPVRLHHSTGRRGDRGVAAVEFAIIVPLLLMLVFAIIGFGFAMAQSAALSSGARAGARLGASAAVVGAVASNVTGCKDVIDQAREEAQTIQVTESDVGVTVQRLTASGAATTVCSIAPGSAGDSGVTTLPCADSGATASTELIIQVTTRLEGRAFTIPVPGASVLTPDTIQKTAEYRCEHP